MHVCLRELEVGGGVPYISDCLNISHRFCDTYLICSTLIFRNTYMLGTIFLPVQSHSIFQNKEILHRGDSVFKNFFLKTGTSLQKYNEFEKKILAPKTIHI